MQPSLTFLNCHKRNCLKGSKSFQYSLVYRKEMFCQKHLQGDRQTLVKWRFQVKTRMWESKRTVRLEMNFVCFPCFLLVEVQRCSDIPVLPASAKYSTTFTTNWTPNFKTKLIPFWNKDKSTFQDKWLRVIKMESLNFQGSKACFKSHMRPS